MADISHFFGNDLAFGPTGDLAVTDGFVWTEQRVLRRLLTNPKDYLWHLEYGAGLGAQVGNTVNTGRIKGLISGQMQMERGVSHNPPPQTTVSSSPDGMVFADIAYVDASTGETRKLFLPPPDLSPSPQPSQAASDVDTPVFANIGTVALVGYPSTVTGVAQPVTLFPSADAMIVSGSAPSLSVGTASAYLLSLPITSFAASSLT